MTPTPPLSRSIPSPAASPVASPLAVSLPRQESWALTATSNSDATGPATRNSIAKPQTKEHAAESDTSQFVVDTVGAQRNPTPPVDDGYPETGDDDSDDDDDDDSSSDGAVYQAYANQACRQLEQAFAALRSHPLVRHHDLSPATIVSFEQMLNGTLPKDPYEHTIAATIKQLVHGGVRSAWIAFMFKARQAAFSLYADGGMIAIALGLEQTVSIHLIGGRGNEHYRVVPLVRIKPAAVAQKKSSTLPSSGRPSPLKITLRRKSFDAAATADGKKRRLDE
jgi:hypothetical protein